ncbi:MAG: hypothetical protein Aureis2KO_25570 [Aureisphaera sp.]
MKEINTTSVVRYVMTAYFVHPKFQTFQIHCETKAVVLTNLNVLGVCKTEGDVLGTTTAYY